MSGLSCLDDPEAIAGLIELSRDAATNVRDWATFGLGSMTEADTPELRAALLARVTDDDPETRGEALIGLANRRDERAIEPILHELAGEYHGGWALEAAERFGLPVFHESILALRPTIMEQPSHHRASFEDALAACQPPSDA